MSEVVSACDLVSPLQAKHREITELNAEIAEAISQVKGNPVLQEFAQTVAESGAFGLMGLAPKIPAILPELAPLIPAIQKIVIVGEKQHELTGEIIRKIEG